MRNIAVTREEIITALREEPNLMPGMFVQLHNVEWIDRSGEHEASTPCGVCAVGAVMRRHGAENLRDIDELARLNTGSEPARGSAVEALARGDYMTALSRFFEQAYGDRRALTIDFVEKHFPEKIFLRVGLRGPRP
jgi:hypothetical protein